MFTLKAASRCTSPISGWAMKVESIHLRFRSCALLIAPVALLMTHRRINTNSTISSALSEM
jgi:hypothetical protein